MAQLRDSSGTVVFEGEITNGGSQPQVLSPVQAWQLPGTSLVQDTAIGTVPNDTIYYFPIRVSLATTYDSVGVGQGASWTEGKKIRLAIYEADAAWQPGALVQDFGEIDQVGSVGHQIDLESPLTLQPGDYLLALVHNDDNGPTTDGADCNPPFGYSYIGANINDYPNSRLSALTVANAYGPYADPGVAWDTPLSVTDTGAEFFFYAVWLRHTP